MEIVQEKDNKDVESVCRHVGSVRAKEGSIKGQPAFEQQDGLLEEVSLANPLSKLLDEVKCEEATELPDRNVNWRASDFEFDHNRVRLVDEVDAGEEEFRAHCTLANWIARILQWIQLLLTLVLKHFRYTKRRVT